MDWFCWENPETMVVFYHEKNGAFRRSAYFSQIKQSIDIPVTSTAPGCDPRPFPPGPCAQAAYVVPPGMGLSINGGAPIAGWVVSSKIHPEMDDGWGYPQCQETSIYLPYNWL